MISNQPRQKKGSLAESFVASRLANQNWLIIKRNYRCVGSEIDIIASKKDTLLAVEVKFRRSTSHLQWDLLLPNKKIQSIRNGLLHFITKYQINATTLRLDLALVYPYQGTFRLKYWVDPVTME